MKNLPLVIVFSLPALAHSQANCDSIAIEEIINLQLELADKWFNQPFVLSKSSVPFRGDGREFKTDSIYTHFPCRNDLTWNQFNLHSKYCSVESDTTTNKEYSLFISAPVFNADKTKCRFVINTHYSEWGGQGRICYYEKRGKKWKMVKSDMLWVS